MWNFIKQLFIWWDEQTMETRFFTWRKGVLVGTDDQGNKYYKHKKNNKRWVIYHNEAEASKVPPQWNAWIHHRSDVTPDESGYVAKAWQAPHIANQTGTAQAYHPPGSLLSANPKSAAKPDYEAWQPE